MEQFKGTPGPWEVGVLKGENKFVYCDDSLGSAICQFDLDYAVLTPEAKKANATLIAEAPELLEKLSEIIELYKSNGYITNDQITESEQLIKKALGL